MSDHREANQKASTLDMVLLFGMPVVLTILVAALWYLGVELNVMADAANHGS